MSVRDNTGRELAVLDADRVLNTASVGKLLLLIEVARRSAADDLDGATLLSRSTAPWAADSGLWQHLGIEQLSVDDLCVLVASVSDNLATNVLLEHVGVQSVKALAESLGLAHTALLDYVRDHRDVADPPTLSTGTASELSDLTSRLSRRQVVSEAVSDRVNGWLATGVDLSMIASGLGLDPLTHAASSRVWFVRNKTGADEGIRADVGTIGRGAEGYAYAVVANWDVNGTDRSAAALSGMRAVGIALKTAIDRSAT